MKYALIATIDRPLSYGVACSGNPMTNDPIYIEAHIVNITASIGTIINLIAYDGISEYTPAEGLRLAQVPDDAKIGDTGY